MKRIRKNRIVVLFLAVVLIFAFCLAGCKGKTSSLKKDSDKKSVKEVSASAVSAEAASAQAARESRDDKNNPSSSGNKASGNKDSSSNNNQAGSSASSSGNTKARGRLCVSGNKLVDSNNNPVQLHGVSTHGLSWFPEYVNKAAFQTMRDDWGVDTIRLAMYTAEYNGYCSGGNKEQLKQLVKNGVSYASELGMYIIIDWHILSDGNPNTHIEDSKAFWQEMANTYKNHDNVIFEICNEPNGGTSWSDVKNYATTILSIIRGAGANNVVLIGTPTWSQDIHLAAADPITGYDNIMYTFHFYAGTHKTDLQNRLSSVVSGGLPVFVSEFGITDASGNGNVDIDSANKWMSVLNSYNISTVCWNLSNKNESSSIINASCNKKSGWSYSDLSTEGQWLVDTYKGVLAANQTSSVPEAQPGNTQHHPDAHVEHHTNGGNGNQNNNQNSQAAASSGTGRASVKCSQTSTWNDGSSDYYQYEVIVTNTGNGTLNGWTADISFSGNIEMNQFWCCNSKINGADITLTPVDYNTNLEPGASCNIGFIVKGASGLKINNTNIK